MSRASVIWARIKYIMIGSPTVRSEGILSACLVGWSIILLITYPQLLKSSPSYKTLAEIAEQWVWGWFFAVTAFVQTVGLVGRLIWLRIAGAALGIFCWSSVTWTFILNSSTPTGYVIYGIFAITSALILLHHVVFLRDKPSELYQ